MLGIRLTDEQKTHYQENGFLVLNRFIPSEVCDLLVERAAFLVDGFDACEHRTHFSTKNEEHAKHRYFLESGDKIRFFFEEGAFDNDGVLTTDKQLAINKIGHGLHYCDPVFKLFSHSHQIARILDDLSVQSPTIVQSMYICKQPYIGGEVKCHQDSTYLHTEGEPVTGIWFALEDATVSNGCLWGLPGGHRTALKQRFMRDGDQVSLLTYDETPWDTSQMIPLEVAKGSAIIFNGLFPHMSHQNQSNHSRHAFTLHVMSHTSTYSASNWLTAGDSFTQIGECR